eukprot:comp22555_c0_seq1/m.34320 comp22555_c0_seq1/g.34320  ORF comp22555_c0_seq1/g.34320 comp22555_c0_seq1/m.34320 type:complete len:1285 (-) comp22555_c0_seq1:310-4164(-)
MRTEKEEALLRYYYELVYNTILIQQHPVTGLLPSFYEAGTPKTPAVATENQSPQSKLQWHAWVRDNVYSILAVWGLALAFKKSVDTVSIALAYELEQSVVKLMRSLLFSMMCQAPKVERFKQTQLKEDSLHAKYSRLTGSVVVEDDKWGHLQVDATSLYILMLSQMTASGIQIIYTLDEVAFMQNLVFYIECAYRIPDYGIWERGDKTNQGLPELNASSIGMAKAALEAINELDLFGAHGGPASVIHVMPDEIRRNQAILESLLPRESNSKEIDAGLLSAISFPAFAVENKQLVDLTRDDIETKLKGNYGCKRFLRDGYMTVLENRERLHYEPAELQRFDNIECEWPLFFSFLILDGIFRGDNEQVREYQSLIEGLLVEPDQRYFTEFPIIPPQKDDKGNIPMGKLSTTKTLPMFYYVPHEKVQAEYQNPHSQERLPSNKAPFLWAQSLFILGALLSSGLVSVGEIDPLNRRHVLAPVPATGTMEIGFGERHRVGSTSSISMRRNSMGSSMLERQPSSGVTLARRMSVISPSVIATHTQDVVVQVALLVQDKQLQMELHQQGIATETPEEIMPITILPASELGRAYTYLGQCDKQHLSGRPMRDIGTLATSKVYKFRGSIIVFTPHFLDAQKFYITLDNELLVDNIKTQLAFIRSNWRMIGRPLMTIMLTKSMFKNRANWHKSNMLRMLLTLKSGYCNGVRIRLSPHRRLLNTSCIEDLAFLETTPFSFSRLQFQDNTGDVLKMDRSKSLSRSKRSGIMGVENAVDVTDMTRHPSNIEVPGQVPAMGASADNLLDHEGHVEHLRQEDYGRVTVMELCEHLSRSETLEEQMDILRYLLYSQGPEFDTGLASSTKNANATVRDLLEEVYRKAGELQLWSIVRHTAGMLRKQADALAESVTDVLVRQKEISVGVPSMWGAQKESIIKQPKSPAELQTLVEVACGDDPAVSVLTQELLVYLAMFIRTEPALFNEMLRVRVGLIIRVMMSELARNLECSENTAYEYLLRRSPFEMKSLLHHMLSGSELSVVEGKKIKNEEDIASAIGLGTKGTHKASNIAGLKDDVHAISKEAEASDELENGGAGPAQPLARRNSSNGMEHVATQRRGQWLRRRQLDGALNRVPIMFYSKVWHVLRRCHGFVVSNHLLPHHPTVQEMTAGEIKFAMRVEGMLNCIVSAEYRQLTVEVLMLLSFILEENRDWYVNHVIDLDAIIAHAVSLFDEDLSAFECCNEDGSDYYAYGHNDNAEGDWRLALFYDNAPSGRHGTMTYLAKAIFQLLPFPSPDACRVC